MDIKREIQKQNIEWRVEINGIELAPYCQMALETMIKDLEFPGFRKGKIPQNLAQNHFSEEQIIEQSALLATRKIAADILAQEIEEWMGQPEIEVLENNKDKGLVFILRATLLPKVILGDWRKKINVKAQLPQVKDEEITKSLNYLRASRAVYRAVNRTAQKGDFVEVSFSGLAGGVQVEGLASRRHPFILGEGGFVEGFEDNIEGMRVGEDKLFTLKVDKSWKHKAVAGREIEFSVKLDALQERLLPEILDDFAKSLGAFKSIDELKASITEGLLAEKKEAEKKRFRLAILDQIIENLSVEIPEVMRKQEADRLYEDMRVGVEQGGYKFEGYLTQIGKTQEGLKEDFMRGAEKRVKASLVLRALAKELAIEPTDEEIQQCINEELIKARPPEGAQKIDPDEHKAYCRSIVRNEKVFEALEAIVEQKAKV
ncbi:MAG: trigger factor [Candidatus Terrybacteria bacterium RIFCSPLOWO2_01_FULL_44_24]|uniref:Trigger factor n=1 Tax=Candidatus Terrybacteria bacterium RIFCSPHIGHO2_01_FULL_43_35 TaxID=1802361 RepID=A0A1G2PG20_9BACT|nr:MAG: trigger factor [Candidatus Terrybacteria bacterium RIFCSPHIGHO2_01_FULL_43_35]OHA50301.1 MAG: trigger factor [Candidatus Terrybacteria bacterium RIFCSPHIGHO2_02_FULL_43_14]OHA50946.1 MAG: trigger factor [Candidatus Terrybacteria bacterium RIFCSPLOWO2_01_FULL_44_24]